MWSIFKQECDEKLQLDCGTKTESSMVQGCWELSDITLGSEQLYTAPCPGPWVLALVMTNSFLDPSRTTMLSLRLFWFIWFDTIICLSNSSCELWNRKLKIKEIHLKNIFFNQSELVSLLKSTLIFTTFRLAKYVTCSSVPKCRRANKGKRPQSSKSKVVYPI